jgi:hypothetical protein
LSLSKLLQIAKSVGGDKHGFAYISTPLNVAMMEPFLEKNQDGESLLGLSAKLGINVMTSSPFLSGFLLQTPLPTTVFHSRYLPVKHLNLIRSLPASAIKSVTVGQKRNRHTKINIQLAQTPLANADKLIDFLSMPKKRGFDSQVPSE